MSDIGGRDTMQDVQRVLARHDRWALVHGDCRELLAQLPDGAVDIVACDPPYNDKTHANATRLSGDRVSRIDIDFDSLTDEEIAALGLNLPRIARRWALAFCALEQLGTYERASGKAWVRSGIYNRANGMPQVTGDRPAQACEGIAIMHRRGNGRMRWNGGGKRGIWTHNVEKSERHHPTVKPLPLMLDLIRDFTEPDELVFDPFCGSGTTGVACLRLGRRFLGCERKAEHYETAVARLKAESRGQTLSQARAGQEVLFR